MTSAEARTEIERLTDWASDPALVTADVDRLLVIATVADRFGSRPGATTWLASTAYTLDALVKPTVANGYQYRAVQSGTTGTTQPSWPTAITAIVWPEDVYYTVERATVGDGTVVWELAGTVWTATYDVSRAVRDGWLLKAAKAAKRFDVSTDGQNLQRSQMHEHCLAMADRFERKLRGRMVFA